MTIRDNFIPRHLTTIRGQNGDARKKVPPPLPHRRARQWRYLTPKDIKGLGNMLFSARRIVEGHYVGKHKSPYLGSSPEFADHREYYPGDEMKSIDWGVYARTDRYFVKRYEHETDMNVYIMLDVSASMAFGGEQTSRSLSKRRKVAMKGISKYEYGCYMSAALSYLMMKQGDRFGLTLFDSEIRAHVKSGTTYGHLHKALTYLERVRKPGTDTQLSTVLKRASGLYRQKGVVIIISDFLDDMDAVLASLNQYVHRGFEVLLFHLFHEHEYRLPAIPHANFFDSETNEEMTCLPADLETSYNEEIDAFVDTWAKRCRARGIDYNFITTATPYHTVLEKYLIKRGKRMR